jgi:hypothetical protein
MGIIPPAVDPGEAEQTATGSHRRDSDARGPYVATAPGNGPLPSGRVDGRRDDEGEWGSGYGNWCGGRFGVKPRLTLAGEAGTVVP